MTATSGDPVEGTSADHTRSGADVAEAIEVAERGSSVQDVHDRPEDTRSGAAPVEQSGGGPAMTADHTDAEVAGGDGDLSRDEAGQPDPGTASSGAAQSVRGARPIDRT